MVFKTFDKIFFNTFCINFLTQCLFLVVRTGFEPVTVYFHTESSVKNRTLGIPVPPPDYLKMRSPLCCKGNKFISTYKHSFSIHSFLKGTTHFVEVMGIEPMFLTIILIGFYKFRYTIFPHMSS